MDSLGDDRPRRDPSPEPRGGASASTAAPSSCSTFRASPTVGGGFVEWDDFAIGEATEERPVTRRLHIGFYAPSPEAVDAWWRELTDAGYASDGAPGPRPAYGPDYYGAFVLDPAGNSIEAVNNGPRRQPGVIDHLWLRTRSLEDATRFYEAVCPAVDHTVERYDGRTQIRGSGATFSIVEGPPTENLHLAFAAPDQETVDCLPRGRRRGGLRVERCARRAAGVPPGLLRRLPDRPRRQQHRGRLPRPHRNGGRRVTRRRCGACGGRGCRRRASRRRSRTRSRAAARRRAMRSS